MSLYLVAQDGRRIVSSGVGYDHHRGKVALKIKTLVNSTRVRNRLKVPRPHGLGLNEHGFTEWNRVIILD